MCLSPYTRRIHVLASAPFAHSPPEPLVNSYMIWVASKILALYIGGYIGIMAKKMEATS